MCKLLKENCKILIWSIVPMIIISFTNSTFSQTVENPIDISIKPINTIVTPGQQSALEMVFKVPRGFWLGDSDPSATIPPPTFIVMKSIENFEFGEALYPKPREKGVPVHKGKTRIFEGKVHVIIPFVTNTSIPEGDYTITAYATYTPGLNAGHLSTHVHEKYTTTVTISSKGEITQSDIPEPFISEVPKDYLVIDEEDLLPEPWSSIMYRWPEGTAIPDFLHWLFIDPDNHGKHIQTVWVPFVGFTENNGATLGMGVSLLNVTREGIMTGQVQLRGFYNEFIGPTIAVEAVSCPAAYFNYWVSAQVSTDGKNAGIRAHVENLTLGKKHRFGYELIADAFQDPRYRFYGVGSGTTEEDKTNYTHKEFGGALDVYWMPVDHWRFGVGGKIRNVDVSDGNDKIREVMPWTTDLTSEGGEFEKVAGIKGATVVGGRVNLVFDSRNSEFTPSAGFYGKATAEFNNVADQVVTTSDPVSNYGKFSVDLRQYFSTRDQILTLLLRNTWIFTTDENIPYFDLATLGGDFSNRAFDNGRFYGQHSVFASMEVRVQMMHIVFMGMPMDVQMAPFLDAGQVFNGDGFTGKFNVNPGMSIRILNPPNLGIIGNAAIGQDGIIFTGGVTLPF
jgi:Omp85 superfamily domain